MRKGTFGTKRHSGWTHAWKSCENTENRLCKLGDETEEKSSYANVLILGIYLLELRKQMFLLLES